MHVTAFLGAVGHGSALVWLLCALGALLCHRWSPFCGSSQDSPSDSAGRDMEEATEDMQELDCEREWY